MNHTLKRKERRRTALLELISLAVFALLIYRGDALTEAAYDSLIFAAERLVPSMFLFAVATGMATALPSPENNKKLPLLKLPISALPALAIGLFSGFPMGAYAAKRLYDRGILEKRSAEHLAAFANNASFAFLYFNVGTLIGEREAGLWLFFSGTLSSLIIGALLMPKEETPAAREPIVLKAPSFFELMSESIVSATSAMLVLCGYLTLFGTVAKALSLLPLSPSLFTAAILFLEPTAAVRHLSTLPTSIALPLIAFALGFSGFSILMQSMSVWQSRLSFWRLFSLRLLIGLLSGVVTLLFIKVI